MKFLNASDDWKELRVSYANNKSDEFAFNRMPFTRVDAEKTNWKQIGGTNASCAGVGYRYRQDNDPAVVPIYAENGIIVGLQTGYPESQMKSEKLIAWYKQQPMFEVEHPEYDPSETLYTLRVYFSNPDYICDKDFKYVHNFYYINGTKKVSVPHEASKLDKIWVKARCNPGKGWHYYDQMPKDLNCDYFQPFFPMYHNETLVAFAFVSFGKFDSKRYGKNEYHPNTQYKGLIDVVPDCLYTVGYNLTTLHGYMIEKPWEIKC
uniref:Uncharacterized protein n=1 Tax=Strigamia maritima TaxID=126957 RepID=T1ISJ9_STRMM